MQLIYQERHKNVIHVRFSINISLNTQVMSKKFIINHSATFYVSYKKQGIYIKFEKLREADPLNYALKLSCDEFSMENRIFNEYGKWHQLYFAYTSIDFTLKVYLEILPAINYLAYLHAETELTDFELRGEDGSVQIHKAVLAASSPVLRKMVTGKFREASQGHVNIKDTTITTLNHLKDYVYLHTLPDTGLEQLLLFASCYMMPDLEQKCVEKLILNMTADNVSQLLKFAVQHELTRLWLSMLDSCTDDLINRMWEKFQPNNPEVA